MSLHDFPSLDGITILQLVPELSAGGVERTVLEMTEAIIAAGGRALVASKGGRLETELEGLGGQLIRMNAKTKNPVMLKTNAARLRQLIRTENIDILHARSRAPAWSAYWAAQACGTAFVTTYHGAYSGTSALKIRYNSVMAKGDIVIANSNWIAAHVEKLHGVRAARLVTIPRGVDLAVFDAGAVNASRVTAIRSKWGLAEDKRQILLLPGRLTDWKGQRVAIAALGSLSPAEREDLVLVLAGDAQGRQSYVRTLEDDIMSAGLGGSVLIMPHIKDMPAAYLAADIVLSPSARPEAFGRVAAEASAMQRAVIVSDHGGGRETVIEGETGARAQPGSANALAGAIRAVLALGAEGRAAMGKSGRAYVAANFSKKGLQAATLNVYKRVLEERRKA